MVNTKLCPCVPPVICTALCVCACMRACMCMFWRLSAPPCQCGGQRQLVLPPDWSSLSTPRTILIASLWHTHAYILLHTHTLIQPSRPVKRGRFNYLSSNGSLAWTYFIFHHSRLGFSSCGVVFLRIAPGRCWGVCWAVEPFLRWRWTPSEWEAAIQRHWYLFATLTNTLNLPSVRFAYRRPEPVSALCRAGRASSRRYRKDGGVFCGGKPWGIGVTLIKSNGDDRLSARGASQPAFTARPSVEDAVRPFLYFTSDLVRAGVA